MQFVSAVSCMRQGAIESGVAQLSSDMLDAEILGARSNN